MVALEGLSIRGTYSIARVQAGEVLKRQGQARELQLQEEKQLRTFFHSIMEQSLPSPPPQESGPLRKGPRECLCRAW